MAAHTAPPHLPGNKSVKKLTGESPKCTAPPPPSMIQDRSRICGRYRRHMIRVCFSPLCIMRMQNNVSPFYAASYSNLSPFMLILITVDQNVVLPTTNWLALFTQKMPPDALKAFQRCLSSLLIRVRIVKFQPNNFNMTNILMFNLVASLQAKLCRD